MIYPLCLKVTSLKHSLCLIVFTVDYGLNKIKLALDAQYKIVELTYLLGGLGLGLGL